MSNFKVLTADIIKSLIVNESDLGYGLNSEVTDYCNLLGCTTYGSDLTDEVYGEYYINGYNSYTNFFKHLRNVYYNWSSNSIGTRPVIDFSLIKENAKKVDGSTNKYQFGEYPQTFVGSDMQKKLDDLYRSKCIDSTNRFYTISAFGKDNSVAFYSLSEYEYEGKKYVRVPYLKDNKIEPTTIDMLDYLPSYWVEVEPITWLVDEELDIAMSEKVLFSGISFSDRELNDSEYYKYVMPILDQYLNRIFIYEINEPSLISPEKEEKDKLLDFVMDKVYSFFNKKKEMEDGLFAATDEIIMNLVNLVDKKNITKSVSSESVINGIMKNTAKRCKGRGVEFADFERAIYACSSVTNEAKEAAVENIKRKKPVKDSGFRHHDDWWEDDYSYYPTCNHLIRRPAEKVYWKRGR